MTARGPSEAGDTPIRVLVVDDHGVVRRGLESYLETVDDIKCVGEAADGQQALDRVASLAAAGRPPHVVMMDLVMPRMDGIQATAALKERYPHVEAVAMTSFTEADRVHAALEAGAAGYLLKDASADAVATAIRAAHRGEVHLDARIGHGHGNAGSHGPGPDHAGPARAATSRRRSAGSGTPARSSWMRSTPAASSSTSSNATSTGCSAMALSTGNGGDRRMMSEINVTPMADVMLVLLIIFMVVTPMLQKGVSVEMAQTANPRDMQEADQEDA